MNFKSR